jgi:hypothetical protein
MARTTQLKNFMVKPAILTEGRTLTNSDSGKTYFLNSAGGFTVTLPAPRAGVNFEFIIRTAPTTAYTIATNGASNIIRGQVITSDVNAATDPDVEITGKGSITFVANTAVKGDSVELISDGTYWWVQGYSSVWNAIGIGAVPKV